MKISLFLPILALAIAPSATASADPIAASSPLPAAQCSIVLREWCIGANSASSISMVDLPYRQLWVIKSTIGMSYGPLVIIYDKTCNESDALNVSFVRESKKRVSENGDVYEASFRLHENGCYLRFEWPAGGADSYAYQEFMAFSVFVGRAEDGYIPLYEFYGKTRCHGIFIKNGLKCE